MAHYRSQLTRDTIIFLQYSMHVILMHN